MAGDSPATFRRLGQQHPGPVRRGKGTNFRGLTIYHDVLYLTKGSGGNGIDTVYFVDTTGEACPSTSPTPGVGLPQPGAPLPTAIELRPEARGE